ncbi:MAG: TonB-dependent receptor [Acidobacteria bacterium]|nr:TonB-dependent receptor [Acidobacteriota bacterium]
MKRSIAISSLLNFKLVLSLLAVLLLPTAAYAQFDTATVLGTITDSTGAAIPGATVTLKNTATGVTATAQSDQNGNYQFFNVKIGSYQVSAEAQGFSKGLAENVQITVNARQRVDLSLKAGAVTETVNISADTAQLLETETSARGQIIGREQIVNLPLNGRAYADLALLSPGVRKSVLNNQDSGGRDASFNVNGLRSSLNNFVLDGVDNNSYGTSNQGYSNQVVQASPDAVQEFQVQTNNFSAEFGRAGGAVINASLRSGTNQFHGSVYDFIRNTSLNAIGFFKPTPPPGRTTGVKPVLIQNQFGATLGGPIIKDKTFFFADYEGFRRITRTLQLATVPTAAQRNGQLGTAVRNPLTGEVYADGNVPSNAITPFAKAVLAALPLPTTNATATGFVSNNYENLPRSKFYNDKFDIKLDQNFSERTTAFVRISHRKLNNYEAPVIGAPVYSPANAFVHALNQQLAVGVTHNLTANSLVEFRLGVSKTEAGKTPTGVGDPVFGNISGLPTDPRFAGGLYTQNISGYTNYGRQDSNPQFQNPFNINPRLNYTFVVKKHSFKTGYEYQRIETDIDDFNPKYGRDTYSGQFSRPTGVTTSNNIYNLADFLFGARNQYDLNNALIITLKQRMHFAYIQDDFKFSPKLTLNLGMRYEFATPQWEDQNRLANFDPTTATLIQAKDGSIYDRALVNPDRNNWAPRVGFAYNLLDKTVLRGGYGISYIHFNRLGGENLLSYNGPNIISNSITQQVSQPLCTANNFLGCFRPTQAGYPDGFVAPERFNPLTARVNFTPKDTRTAYVQSWHLTLQHELPWKLLLDVGYVGNRSNKLIVLADYNQARPNNSSDPAAGTPLQQRRPFANYSFIQASYNAGFTTYNALQIKLERRFADGLYLLNSFTWSKALDNVAGHLEANSGDNSRINIKNLANDKGRSNYDQPYNNTTSVVYDLPFGKGRKMASGIPTALDYVIGGWRATLINTLTSGLPANLTYSPSSAFQVGSSLTYRPNQILPDLYTPEGQRDPSNYLNYLAVTVPTDRSQPFGTAGRNTVRGPNFWQTDLGLHKAFPVWHERTRLEFRMEAFNLFNRSNFQVPNTSASSIRIVNGAPAPGGSYGQITSTYPARQIQFALKLIF